MGPDVSKRGPLPKENPQRRNDGPAREIGGHGNVTAPPLPDATYLPQTIAWYEAWCNSEQASILTALDWQRLHMLAPLVDAYWQKPSKDLMAEIRQNESKLGATFEDRQRLRLKISAPESERLAGDEKPKSRERKDPRAK